MVHNFLHRESVTRVIKQRKWKKAEKKKPIVEVAVVAETPSVEVEKKTRKKNTPVVEENNNE